MFFYAGKTYTATVHGTMRKQAKCSKCGGTYDYTIKREATGSSTSHYHLDNVGAAKRAVENASFNLDQLLKMGIEAVPCPKCGGYDAGMARLLQPARTNWAATFVAIIMFSIAGISILLLFGKL